MSSAKAARWLDLNDASARERESARRKFERDSTIGWDANRAPATDGDGVRLNGDSSSPWRWHVGACDTCSPTTQRIRPPARGITRSQIREAVDGPEQRFPQRRGRDIFQSRVTEGPRTWLLRVIVDVDRDPAEVVTVYRTSSIMRYWRALP